MKIRELKTKLKKQTISLTKPKKRKKQRIDKLMKQIEENIDSQQKRRKMISDQEKRNEKGFVELWKDKMNHLEEAEALEKNDIKERNKNLQDFLKQQMAEKKKKAQDEFLKEHENTYKTKGILHEEQIDFLQHAEALVNEYKSQGKDINPLLLELKKYKKKMFFG